jgi:L-threonylcarbamoyladenylate synthase
MAGHDQIEKAVTVLRNGGVVAFPTETYYGLAVDPTIESALQRLFALKKRPRQKPILLITHAVEQLYRLTDGIPDQYQVLMDRFWPGPLTLIFNALPAVSSLLTAGTGTVGVRISSHPVADLLARQYGRPVTATSANISGREAAVSAAEVRDYFNDSVDFVLDGGRTLGGVGSTVVKYDDSTEKLLLLREGMITCAEINSVYPEVIIVST